MKIRIATTSPKNWTHPSITAWSVKTIDEFVERFVRGDRLVIGKPDRNGVETLMRNFVVHNDYIATFETDDHPRALCAEIILALSGVDAPVGKAAFHNVNVDVIPQDYDPLKNPRAEAAR